jgi:hypothetical protein
MDEPVKAPPLCGPIAYQGYVSDARIGNNVVLGDKAVLYAPVELTEEEEDFQMISQVAGLLGAAWGNAPKAEVAHLMLCASCPCIPDRIRAMNPNTNPWRSRIYDPAYAMVEAKRQQFPRSQLKKFLSAKMAEFLSLGFARKKLTNSEIFAMKSVSSGARFPV